MKKTYLLTPTFLFFFLFPVLVDAQSYTFFSPTNDNIQYEGRISFLDPSKPVFSFPGVSIKVKFQGTAAKVRLKGYSGENQLNFFNVFVDGTFIKKFAIGNETLTEICQTGLPATTHTLEITKRTENFLGRVEFLGFDIAGDLLPPDAKPERKIEFIGNSITCGYGNEDVSTGGFDPALENNYLAYGAVCARELNARYQAVAYSGRGVAFNYNCTGGDLLPVIYEKYIGHEAAGGFNQYNHNDYIPDVIVINLGTNDHNCSAITDENFKTAYTGFIQQLKTYFPQVKIVCLTGPMNTSEVFKNRIEDIVETSGGAADGVYFFHQTGILGVEYTGGHGHPNTLMADINGKEVAEFIENEHLFGVNAISPSPVFESYEKIYPNPVHGRTLTVDLTGFPKVEKINLRLINRLGKTILKKTTATGQIITIDTGDLSGLLLLQLTTGDRNYIEKVIVF